MRWLGTPQAPKKYALHFLNTPFGVAFQDIQSPSFSPYPLHILEELLSNNLLLGGREKYLPFLPLHLSIFDDVSKH